MSGVCSNCGVEGNDTAIACPVCGESGLSTVSGLTTLDRLAAGFAYFTFIPAVIFLLLARFKRNSFVRFHSFQSIFLSIGASLLAGALRIGFLFLSFIPFLVAALIATIACLGCFLLWIVLLVKALQGRKFKLPWIGDFAEEQARRR